MLVGGCEDLVGVGEALWVRLRIAMVGVERLGA